MNNELFFLVIAQSLTMAKVEYEKPAADLHTELFAKIPFPLAGNTLSDRMASSVMQILGLIRCGSL